MGYEDKMMRSEDSSFKDIELKCVETGCENKFIFTSGEQEYYATKVIVDEATGKERFLLPPKRCIDCRNKKKAQKMGR